jgi:protein ImuA
VGDFQRQSALVPPPRPAETSGRPEEGEIPAGQAKAFSDIDKLRSLLAVKHISTVRHRSFRTGIQALDEMAPGGAFARGAVHEFLSPARAALPKSLVLLLAQAAREAGGAIAWSDPWRELYPPALAAMGIDLRRLLLLRCGNRADELWGIAECLRSGGVNATIASIEQLSQIEARRLQLAAERGGGVGLFMRASNSKSSANYAAATRWLVKPAPGGHGVQRWNVQLLHGHGGHLGKVLLLELDRETRTLRAHPAVADRPTVPASARASA